MIEIFSDRMEITNPDIPLIETERFLDSPPKSRNESPASLMRRIGVCEERESGIDKVVFETEFNQLSAPLFETVEDHTHAVLFGPKTYAEMDQNDRIRACYLHACLKRVNHSYLTNASLRERFGIKEKNRSMVSRIIRDTLGTRLIKPADPESDSRRLARYLPFWA